MQHTQVAVALIASVPLWFRRNYFMSKPFATLEKQIEILKSRGVVFNDEELAKSYLYKCGYYNLINAYKELFLASTSPEHYLPGTKFECFLVAHDIDFAYRQIILSRIIGIENSLKSIVAYEFAKSFGAEGYCDLNNFKERDTKKCRELQISINKTIEEALKPNRANDLSFQCVRHHHEIHHEIPIWILFRVLYFGQFIMFYECLKDDTKNNICKGISNLYKTQINRHELYNYLKILGNMRNLCAHGQRIYNFSTRRTINPNDACLRELLRYEPNFNLHTCNVIIPIFHQLLGEKEFDSFSNEIIGVWTDAFRKTPIAAFDTLLEKILGRHVLVGIIEYMREHRG